ncbi:MAG: 3'-5' exoribonuclease domain-containing protein [Candidatus Thorarchaeota archaeon]|jgi:hypothetical protein
MSKPSKEVYVSTDIESDGPIPGEYSMLSMASAAFLPDGKMVDTFTINLELLEGASQSPETMEWWKTQPEAWEAARSCQVHPAMAMRMYDRWLSDLHGHGLPVFVGYPAGYDFTFVYWYLMKFVGRSVFSFSALDIKTFAMAALNSNYRQATKRNMPKEWFKGAPKHTHLALDDAIGQGILFCNILKEAREKAQ